MKECWINVYRYDGLVDYMHVCNSDLLSKRDLSNHINSRRFCHYRLHVKLKNIKPKYDELIPGLNFEC